MSALLNNVGNLEFFLEQLVTSRIREPSEKTMVLEVLSLVELFKAYLRLRQMNNVQTEAPSPNQLFLSQPTPPVPVNSPLQDKVQRLLAEMQQPRQNVFRPQQEVLVHQNKVVEVEQGVMLPGRVLALGMEKASHGVVLGELVFCLRPLIYCFLLRRFGVKSYVPYGLSLVLDLLRLWLQRTIRFYSQQEQDEFAHRNKELLLCYLLRNPLYEGLVKKVLAAVLFRLVPGRLSFLSSLVFTLVEYRCSLSLLM